MSKAQSFINLYGGVPKTSQEYQNIFDTANLFAMSMDILPAVDNLYDIIFTFSDETAVVANSYGFNLQVL
jgi:hypothetical protein